MSSIALVLFSYLADTTVIPRTQINNMRLADVTLLLAQLLPLGVAGAPTVRWADPIVKVPYATYQGYHNDTSGLDVFLGVRYAASTEGQNRWRIAQPPTKQSAMVDASKFGPQCPQAVAGDIEQTTGYNPLETTDSEDCLLVNIYGDTSAKSLPVFVWIHGGSWEFNSAREFDPTPMINFSNNSFIGVILQYRLGALGLLQSPQMLPDQGNNVAITDSVVALRWVQQYIHLFGGDPTRVTVAGESSGAGTIAMILSAQSQPKRANESLFKNAFIASPFLTPTGQCDNDFWSDLFHQFSAAANCTNDLECLRRLSTDEVKILNNQFSRYKYRDYVQPYLPCIEGAGGYLTVNPAERLYQGLVPKVNAIVGNNFQDGFGFASDLVNPSNTSSNFAQEADELLKGYVQMTWPISREDVLDEIVSLYPLDQFESNHARAGLVYQDAVFACADNWIGKAGGSQAWRYLYAEPPAFHAQDNAQEFPIFYGSRAPDSPSFYGSFIGPLVSLILHDDPNAISSLRPKNDPSWPSYSDGAKYKVLNITAATNVSDSYISSGSPAVGTQQRCDFWARTRIAEGF